MIIERFKRRHILENIIKKLEKEFFINNHKANLQDFTRDRTLNFAVVFMLILKKSIKSLQLMLNELFLRHEIDVIVSSSAYTQARKKFKHTAFIELNDDTIRLYYEDDQIKRWKGYRCFGVDGSKLILPNTEEIKKVFGEIPIRSQHVSEGSYACAMFECYYDVLNHIAIKSQLVPGASYEVDVASTMLSDFNEKDLLIYDRGYASYEFLATLTQAAKSYIVRCPTSSFKATCALFENRGPWSETVNLSVSNSQAKHIHAKGLPSEIPVRFVRVVLSTGEIEVLATSIMDETLQPDDFKLLYGMRWGVESFYHLIKERLCLENFTGKSVEAVRQDFWSTLLLSNLESVLTEEVEEVNEGSRQSKKKVNHAVSFNALKNMAFEIFLHEKDIEKTMEKLSLLFKTGMFVERKDRSPPRREKSARRSCNFLKRIKKLVY